MCTLILYRKKIVTASFEQKTVTFILTQKKRADVAYLPRYRHILIANIVKKQCLLRVCSWSSETVKSVGERKQLENELHK